jgi:uroporphyrinogen-III synthase
MKTILVIREQDAFSRNLAGNGIEIINLPLIETKVAEDLSDFDEHLEKIEKYDGVFVTSRNAARITAEKLIKKKIVFGGKFYVLGTRSFEILKKLNLNLVFDETANTAREMLENIAPEDLKNKSFLFVRGEKSLRVVPDFLEKVASVEESIVYRTEKFMVEIGKKNELREKFENGEIAATCFFSPSQAETFLEQFGANVLHQTVIAVIGKTTAEYFNRQNVQVDFVSSKATAEDFAIELIEYLKEDLPAKDPKKEDEN